MNNEITKEQQKRLSELMDSPGQAFLRERGKKFIASVNDKELRILALEAALIEIALLSSCDADEAKQIARDALIEKRGVIYD